MVRRGGIHHDHLIIRIILIQKERQVLEQIIGLILGTDDDADRRLFVCNRQLPLSKLASHPANPGKWTAVKIQL